MSELYALVEIAFTTLISGFWTFILYILRPQWVSQNLRSRVIVSALEGILCALAWILLLVVTSTPITLGSIEIAVLCGLIWAVVAIYTRGRYKTALSEATVPSHFS